MSCCPTTFAEAQRHHDDVRADASTGNPSTPHGRALLATARPWPEFDVMIGECGGCGSTLSFRVGHEVTG